MIVATILNGPLIPIFIVLVVLIVIIISAGYKKAPPDKAFIISGLKKRTVIGKSCVMIPLLERKDELNLRLISIDVKTASSVPTSDYININVDAVANVKVSSDPAKIKLAAENFLNQRTEYIAQVAREILEGNMREIVGAMQLEKMVSDRQEFANKVKENAVPDLAAMGLDIVNFNVQNFKDANGVIEDLGIDNTMKIKKKAAIAKAEAERDIKIAQSSTNKEANDAAVDAETEIAKRNNDLAIRKADLKMISDTKQAAADAAYQIQKEEQRKTILVTSSNAEIARLEREVELKAKAAQVEEKALEAEIKKKADAEKYAAQQKADVELYKRQKEAEARKYEIAQNAEARKLEAEAELYAKIKEAEGIKMVGEAEAEAIRAKGIAEAEGIDKKAEAMQKMDKAAILEMYFNALPEIVKNAATPLEKVDKITMYGEGNSSKLIKDIVNTTTQVTEGVKQSTGIDLPSLIAGFVGSKVIDNKNENNE